MTINPGYERTTERPRMTRDAAVCLGVANSGYDLHVGRRIDEDPTGLLNEGFRYRDLETGVFLTKDPLGFVDGPNLYTYVRQNPWTKFDPRGLRAENDVEKKALPKMEKMRDQLSADARIHEIIGSLLKNRGKDASEPMKSAKKEREQAESLSKSISMIRDMINDAPDDGKHDSKNLRVIDSAFQLWTTSAKLYTKAAAGGNRTGKNAFYGSDKCNIAVFDILTNAGIATPGQLTNDVIHPIRAGFYNTDEDIPGLQAGKRQYWPHIFGADGSETQTHWSGDEPLPGAVISYGDNSEHAHVCISLGAGWHIGASSASGAEAFGQDPGININTSGFEHFNKEGYYPNRQIRDLR